VKPEEFLPKAVQAAKDGGHIWPEYAACEAALESGWGTSKLARVANNLFGQKDGKEDYPNVGIPTKEWIKGKMVTVDAMWPVFPDWKTSFEERMALLHRVGSYAKALAAKDGETFVQLVSHVWATDPERGNKVLSIYRKHFKAAAATAG
jgi:flagellum-specific peptidoglycan hydrolase FlgJ